MSMPALLFLGFLIGMRHALEADHVAAVASLATRASTPAQCVRQGVLWGLGHTATLFAVGMLVLVLDTAVPERVASWLELVVGLMLIALGVDVLRRLRRQRIHFHRHRHGDGTEHLHAHSHAGQREHGPREHEHAHGASVRAFSVGLMHGMAGSAALIVLTAERTSSLGLGLVYMLVFGLGSVLGMALLSAVIAVPFRASASALTRFHVALQLLVGAGTILLGVVTVASSVWHGPS